MRRFVFTPRWMLGHLFIVLAVIACVRLGDWQLDRAHVTEALQNWGYAFQWPLFALFFGVGWWRMLRLESNRLDDLEAAGGEESAPAEVPPVLVPPPAEPPGRVAAEPDLDDDPEHAAYNRMLAALAAQDEAADRA